MFVVIRPRVAFVGERKEVGQFVCDFVRRVRTYQQLVTSTVTLHYIVERRRKSSVCACAVNFMPCAPSRRCCCCRCLKPGRLKKRPRCILTHTQTGYHVAPQLTFCTQRWHVRVQGIATVCVAILHCYFLDLDLKIMNLCSTATF